MREGVGAGGHRLGAFARQTLGDLDSAGLDMCEALLADPDSAIYAWAIGNEPVPPAHDNAVMAALRWQGPYGMLPRMDFSARPRSHA